MVWAFCWDQTRERGGGAVKRKGKEGKEALLASATSRPSHKKKN